MNKKGKDWLYGPSKNPVKYSSVRTRYASLHPLQCGAEFNEVNAKPQPMPGETPNDWGGMNIRSAVNRNDCPSKFGSPRGMQRIGNQVFTPEMVTKGWVRRKGEPVY